MKLKDILSWFAYLILVTFGGFLVGFIYGYQESIQATPIAIWNEDTRKWQCIGGDRECDIYWCETFGDCKLYQDRLAYEEYGFWPNDSLTPSNREKREANGR